MEIKIFTVAAIGGEEVNEELNRFMRGHKVVCVDKQYFANYYLSSLDHYVKESLRVPFYVRYMDDICFFKKYNGI